MPKAHGSCPMPSRVSSLASHRDGNALLPCSLPLKGSGVRLQYSSFLTHWYTQPILRLIYFLTTSVLLGPQILFCLGDS